jgi:hypothetical protein
MSHFILLCVSLCVHCPVFPAKSHRDATGLGTKDLCCDAACTSSTPQRWLSMRAAIGAGPRSHVTSSHRRCSMTRRLIDHAHPDLDTRLCGSCQWLALPVPCMRPGQPPFLSRFSLAFPTVLLGGACHWRLFSYFGFALHPELSYFQFPSA